MAYSSLFFCNLYFFRSLAIFFKCAIKLTWLIRPPFHSLEFSFCVFVEWIVQKIDIGIKKVFRIWLVLSFACYNPLHMWRFKACWRFCWDLLTRAIKTLNWASRTEQRWMHFARFTFLPRTLCVEIQTEHRKLYEKKKKECMQWQLTTICYYNLFQVPR